MKKNIVEEEQEEYQGLTLEGYKLYALIAACLITFSVISYNAYTARSEAQKANTQLTQQKASTGAKIESLMNTITENKKQWAEMELKQEKLNTITEKSEEALAKFNIIITK